MSVNFSHPSIAGRGATAAATRPEQDSPRPLGPLFVDLPAARLAERSCCCSAKPTVIAVMPLAPHRPRQTDLLLCGHHYRVSRQALDAAGVAVMDIEGTPVTGSHWPLTRA
jgi:hypothetical protein